MILDFQNLFPGYCNMVRMELPSMSTLIDLHCNHSRLPSTPTCPSLLNPLPKLGRDSAILAGTHRNSIIVQVIRMFGD